MSEPSQNPKRIAIVKESTFRFVVRTAETFLGVVIILSSLWFFLIRLFPTGRVGIGVGYLVLLGAWTLATVFGTVSLAKDRKSYREQTAASSSPTDESAPPKNEEEA
jgi:hypothetical protein